VIYAIIMYLCKITGFAARSMVQDGTIALPANVTNPADYSFIVASEYVFPTIFAPVVAIIVLSAVMSTTDRLMLTIGSYVSWDIYKQYLNKDASEKTVTMLSRAAILAATILTLYLAWSKPPELLAFLIWMGIGVMLACFVAPLFAGLYWRRATREGALASMIVGLICVSFFSYYTKYVTPLPMHPSIYGFVASIAAMVAVSLMTPAPSEKILDETMTGMYIRKRGTAEGRSKSRAHKDAVKASEAVKR
jgi:SSS family solute:Na+ symporter